MELESLIRDRTRKHDSFDEKMCGLKERQNKVETSIKYFKELLGKSKARAPPEQEKRENLPRILYHGTCDNYFYDNLMINKEYNPGGIYLTDRSSSAAGWAMRRAEVFHDKPLMLIIDTAKSDDRVEQEHLGNVWTIKRLNLGSFVLYESSQFVYDSEGKYTAENFAKISKLENFLLRNNKYNIKRHNEVTIRILENAPSSPFYLGDTA